MDDDDDDVDDDDENESGSYVEAELIGPLPDDLVLGAGALVDLVLENIVAAGGVAVLVESHRRPGASCRNRK